MNKMIAAHQRMIAVNDAKWRLWACGFQAGRFQTAIGKALIDAGALKYILAIFQRLADDNAGPKM